MGVSLALCLCGEFVSAGRHLGAEQDTHQLQGPGLPKQHGPWRDHYLPSTAGQTWLFFVGWPCFLSLSSGLSCPYPIQRESPPRSLTGSPVSTTPAASSVDLGPQRGTGREKSMPHRARNPRGPPPDRLRVYVCPHVTMWERQELSTVVSQRLGPVIIHGAQSPRSRY